MSWVEGISQAIRFIEANITEELAIDEIARQAYVSPFYFQKGFTMLCGLSVGEYIRQRRLTLAGSELVATDMKVIDIALKYGYDSPDSFTRAFFRFHGVTPTAVRKDGAMIRSLAPLSIKLVLKGGYTMDYEIAAGYNIEMYSNVDDYPNGNQDSRYYSEIWIPVKRKR